MPFSFFSTAVTTHIPASQTWILKEPGSEVIRGRISWWLSWMTALREPTLIWCKTTWVFLVARSPPSLAGGDSCGDGQKVGELLANVPGDMAGSVLCSLLVEGELLQDRNHKILSLISHAFDGVTFKESHACTICYQPRPLLSAIQEDRQAALYFVEKSRLGAFLQFSHLFLPYFFLQKTSF